MCKYTSTKGDAYTYSLLTYVASVTCTVVIHARCRKCHINEVAYTMTIARGSIRESTSIRYIYICEYASLVIKEPSNKHRSRTYTQAYREGDRERLTEIKRCRDREISVYILLLPTHSRKDIRIYNFDANIVIDKHIGCYLEIVNVQFIIRSQ